MSSNQWRSVAQYSPDYTGQRSWSRSGGLQLETSTTARSCPTSPSPSVAPVIRSAAAHTSPLIGNNIIMQGQLPCDWKMVHLLIYNMYAYPGSLSGTIHFRVLCAICALLLSVGNTFYFYLMFLLISADVLG